MILDSLFSNSDEQFFDRINHNIYKVYSQTAEVNKSNKTRLKSVTGQHSIVDTYYSNIYQTVLI